MIDMINPTWIFSPSKVAVAYVTNHDLNFVIADNCGYIISFSNYISMNDMGSL